MPTQIADLLKAVGAITALDHAITLQSEAIERLESRVLELRRDLDAMRSTHRPSRQRPGT